MWLFGVKFIIDKNAHNTISHGTFKSIANFLLAEERKKQKIFVSHTLMGGGGGGGGREGVREIEKDKGSEKSV